MVVSTADICPFGWKARDFALKGVDGKTYSLADIRGPKGTLVVFSCNHCPYVKASISRIVAEANALRQIGIGTIAIMPNDTEAYPEDSFDKMRAFAAHHGFSFPYVIDTTQEVTRAYAAQCTPEFFGFNAQDELQYRGRLDASRMTPIPNARRDLFEAMKQVAETGRRSNFHPWAVRSSGSTDRCECKVEQISREAHESVSKDLNDLTASPSPPAIGSCGCAAQPAEQSMRSTFARSIATVTRPWPALFPRCPAARADRTRHLRSSCAYRAPASLMKCARNIGAAYWASEPVMELETW
jgi:peroxiredoxin